MRLGRLAVLAAAMSMSAGTFAHGAIIIDDFNSTSTSWPFSILPPPVTSTMIGDLVPTGILGSVRWVTLFNSPGTGAGIFPVAVAVSTIDSGAGILDYVSPAERDGMLALSYVPATPTDLLGATSVSVDVLRYDGPGTVPMQITLELTGGTGYSSFTLPCPPSASPQTITFTLPAGLPELIDLSQVRVIFDPPAGGDFRLDGITAAVPEPGALSVLALLPLAGRRRAR